MDFYKYIGKTPSEFEPYLSEGYVERHEHPTFPLDIFTYGRMTVQEQHWDHVTSRCRGIIVNRVTGEIVARPFEKFHNYGSTQNEEYMPGPERLNVQPTIWEKMDGFLCTQYEWEGKQYIASKGSFTSPHAKWATAELQRHQHNVWPTGMTAVYEGLHPDLRIVVDYGTRKSLVLLALIDIETGEELGPLALRQMAKAHEFESPALWENTTLEDVRRLTLQEGSVGEEGFVLAWYREGTTPFRLKMKYIDYLRLHRMVTGVSPKRIWEVLAQRSPELDDYVNSSPVWFKEFVTKWVSALRKEHKRISIAGTDVYAKGMDWVQKEYPDGFKTIEDLRIGRKLFADFVTRPENKEFSGIAFAILDKKDADLVCWKQVRKMTSGSGPMMDAHNL